MPKSNYSVLALLKYLAIKYKNCNAISLKQNNKWIELTYTDLSKYTKLLSNYLMQLGINKNDKIAILSESCPGWAITFFSSIRAGTITVPLDTKLTETELANILSDCLPKVIFTSTTFLSTAENLKEKIPSIEHIFIIENADDKKYKSIYNIEETNNSKGINRNYEETALIVYTSGTTGAPKGVVITFENIISQIKDISKVFSANSGDVVISILPLNHLLEFTAGFLWMLSKGVNIVYPDSLTPNKLTNLFQEKGVTIIVVVPLFLKMLKTSIEKQINKQPIIKKKLFYTMFNVAKFIPSLKIKKILFKNIHKVFGDKLKMIISGAAPLDKETALFFSNIGIPVYEGYGLTETSPVLTVNNPKNNKIGSVGKPLESVSINISSSGEILAKGPNIMKGYYNNPNLTNEVIDSQGWFHTGDIGYIDKNGFLYITGRIKNLIVLGGGKKVHPEEIETALEKSIFIKEACIFSSKIKQGYKTGTEDISAVIVPADEILAKNKNEVENIIKSEVKKISLSLAPYKRPNNIIISYEELPKTTTKKIKRSEITTKYSK